MTLAAVSFGPLAVTIPPGHFTLVKGQYKYSGTLSGIKYGVTFSAPVHGVYEFTFAAFGVDVTGITNPVSVTLQIGANIGTDDDRSRDPMSPRFRGEGDPITERFRGVAMRATGPITQIILASAICIFASSPICRAAESANPAGDRTQTMQPDAIAPGTVITMANWQQYKAFMPDGMAALFEGKYFWKMPPDVRMEVGPTIIHPLPKNYRRCDQQIRTECPRGGTSRWRLVARELSWRNTLPQSFRATQGMEDIG